MAEIERYSGNVQAFGSQSQGTERTVFGDTTQSDTLDANITADFLRGWGIVGVNENPTKQDFNGLAFTLSQLIAYLHQRGVPEWNASQEYFEGSVVTTLAGVYRLLAGGDGSIDPDTDDGTNWEKAPTRAEIDQRTIYVGSVAELEALSLPAGTSVYLTQEGRSGSFLVKSGTPPWSDPKKGLYIVLANGNYAVRQRGQAVIVGGVIRPEWFGLVSDDETPAVAEENHSIIRECLVASIHHYIGDSILDYAPMKVECPSGKIFIKGNSAFCLTRSEMEALGTGASRYMRGLHWAGAGRKATRFILMNDGAETWLYDNRDAAHADTSVQDYTTFSDMSLESYDHYKNARKYPVAAASKINGFYMETYGWEKFFNFNNVTFEGFDALYRLRGDGNGDQNTWHGCRAFGIIDVLFDINNNQSVTNRIFGMDAFTHGDVFRIGLEGGGDFSWTGGSVIQYPVYAADDNLPDNTASAGNLRAFLKFDNGNNASGISLTDGNGKFVFNKLRFENYDDYQHLVYSTRNDIVNYGILDVTFNDCQNLVEQDLADDGTLSSKAGRRNLVLIDKQTTTVRLNSSPISKNHDFRVIDVGSSTVNGIATILLNECRLAWDAVIDGTLKSRFYADVVSSDECHAIFRAVDCPSTIGRDDTKSCEDFSVTASSSAISTDKLTYVHIKDKTTEWPNGANSGNRLYLPEGAVVTSVYIDKEAVTGAAGSATYNLRLADSSNAVFYNAPDHQEDGAQLLKADIGTPYKIPAFPNNYIQLWGNGGTGVSKGASECFMVGYFTSKNS